MKLTVTIILFFIFLNSHSQNDTIYILGKVVDKNSNPIENANILNLSNNTGTTTNRNGFFFAKAEDFPISLKISSIGFETREITLSKKEFEAIEDLLTIRLKKKVYTLDEIKVSIEKPKVIRSTIGKSIILDYKIIEDELIILLKAGRSRLLEIYHTETLTSFELSLSINGEVMFEDCMGNIHILTPDSVYQIKIDFSDSTLIIFEPYSKEKFKNSLENCIGNINNNFIFKSVFNHNQKIVYWYPAATIRKELYCIYDQERESFAQNFLDQRNELIKQYGVINEMGEITVSQLNVRRRIKRLEFGYQFLGKIPAYNPLFVRSDTFLIFDNLRNTIVSFDSNFSFLREVPMLYQTNNSQRVFLDKSSGRIFIEEQSVANNLFYEIDVNSGKTINTIKIENSIFPENVCFYGNKVYYIDNDLNNGKSLKTLTID
ncbi:MAG: carboxypeptidase-like regulatory domain-containing protein [Bacteroidales bacterium]|nr:carboxypeptidase-like regulatory domain-containing protein [Bacteroidales bacterium]